MRKNLFYLIIFVFGFTAFSHASEITMKYASEIEEAFLNQWRQNRTTSIDTLTAWLVADETIESADILSFKATFEAHYKQIKDKVDRKMDAKDKAEEIFKYLHKNVFTTPYEESNIHKIFTDGRYNSITGSAIFYTLCARSGIPIEMMSNSYYVSTRIADEKGIIEIDILDQKNGFNKKIEKKDIIESLVKAGIIDPNSIENENIDQIYDEYFSLSQAINPYLLAGVLYNKHGVRYVALGNMEKALQYFEKALCVEPWNDIYLENYKTALYSVSDIMIPYDTFIPYLENSLWFLQDDPSFVDYAIWMSNKAISYYADDLREYQKALDLIFEFKTRFHHEKYLKTLLEYESTIEFNWAIILYNRGEYEQAYLKIKNIYFKNRDLPKNKDAYVELAIKYSQQLLLRGQDYSRVSQIMDTLYLEASDYPVVKEVYIAVLLAPFQKGPAYVQENPKEAYELAHKVYKMSPDHTFSKRILSQVYHELAMAEIRKNNLVNAHRILVEGLELFPDDKLLNDDFKQLEDAF